jgi:hypothetical protein
MCVHNVDVPACDGLSWAAHIPLVGMRLVGAPVTSYGHASAITPTPQQAAASTSGVGQVALAVRIVELLLQHSAQ